mmetsp:Transcript_88520/g.277193  ORF Transcript_88520/g.277193 Transcript_88520/m.277193 type:complete len:221 (+) Transcript_88520:18-680(+)
MDSSTPGAPQPPHGGATAEARADHSAQVVIAAHGAAAPSCACSGGGTTEEERRSVTVAPALPVDFRDAGGGANGADMPRLPSDQEWCITCLCGGGDWAPCAGVGARCCTGVPAPETAAGAAACSCGALESRTGVTARDGCPGAAGAGRCWPAPGTAAATGVPAGAGEPRRGVDNLSGTCSGVADLAPLQAAPPQAAAGGCHVGCGAAGTVAGKDARDCRL